MESGNAAVGGPARDVLEGGEPGLSRKPFNGGSARKEKYIISGPVTQKVLESVPVKLLGVDLMKSRWALHGIIELGLAGLPSFFWRQNTSPNLQSYSLGPFVRWPPRDEVGSFEVVLRYFCFLAM